MVGILVSFWDGLFSGAMLVWGSVCRFFMGLNNRVSILEAWKGYTKSREIRKMSIDGAVIFFEMFFLLKIKHFEMSQDLISNGSLVRAAGVRITRYIRFNLPMRKYEHLIPPKGIMKHWGIRLPCRVCPNNTEVFQQQAAHFSRQTPHQWLIDSWRT